MPAVYKSKELKVGNTEVGRNEGSCFEIKSICRFRISTDLPENNI